MSNLIDTLINLQIFAFIGLLVWLYFRPYSGGGEEGKSQSDDD